MFEYISLYQHDIDLVLAGDLPWQDLDGKSVLITGATGMIGTALVDTLIKLGEKHEIQIDIWMIGRNEESAKKRFCDLGSSRQLHFIEGDISSSTLHFPKVDYVIHAASNAYPMAFSEDPVGTMKANLFGTSNLLDFSRDNGVRRFLLVSTGEIYGEGSDVSAFTEDYSGYVDCMSPRACYPSSKRAAETLCASYGRQYGLETVVARPCHVYGPTCTDKDSRVSSQFMRQAIKGEDLIMKSEGLQVRSYCYVFDCVSALITIMLKGVTGNAYNIADNGTRVSIRDFCKLISEAGNVSFRQEIPERKEKEGFTVVTRAILDSTKLMGLGWKPLFSLEKGIRNSLSILAEGAK